MSLGLRLGLRLGLGLGLSVGLVGCGSGPERAPEPPSSTTDARLLLGRPLPATLLYPIGPGSSRWVDAKGGIFTRTTTAPNEAGVWAVTTETPDGLVDTRLELTRTPEGAVHLVGMEIARDSELDRYLFSPPLVLTPPVLPTTAAFTASASVSVRGPGRSLDGTVFRELERIVDERGVVLRSDLRFDLGLARIDRNALLVIDPDAAGGPAIVGETRERTVRAGPITVSRERTVLSPAG